MNDKSAFLTHFFEKLKDVKYAVLGFTYRDLANYESESLHLVVQRDDNKIIYHILEFSPYLRKIRLIDKPFVSTIALTFGDGSKFDINLVNAFVRQGVCYMSEVEVLRNTITNNLGIKQAAPSYNFEYVWLLHLLNKTNVADHYRLFFSQYDRETRSGIFAHIRGRYFLELNILDELYDFHKRYYSQVKEKILRRKENKWYKKVFRKLQYVPYAFLNLIRTNNIKIKLNSYKKGAFSSTEQARLY